MTFERASKAFNKQYPKRQIMSAADLDNKNFVVVAQEDPRDSDFADPIFLINKLTGEASQIQDISNMRNISEAFKMRKIV